MRGQCRAAEETQPTEKGLDTRPGQNQELSRSETQGPSKRWRQKNFKEDKKILFTIRASKMAAGPWRPAEDLQNTESSEEQRNLRRSLIGRRMQEV